MIFPYLIFIIGFLAVLAYFARKNVTWDTRSSTQGSVGMAIIVFIIAALIAWGIDAYIDWSVIPQYMYAAGGALQMIAIVFFAFYAGLCLSMMTSASKVGTMVA
jgi:ABC-type multidrug transport system fused ATPase/permease subunit